MNRQGGGLVLEGPGRRVNWRLLYSYATLLTLLGHDAAPNPSTGSKGGAVAEASDDWHVKPQGQGEERTGRKMIPPGKQWI